jgi:CarD family transcriptional regulator
MTTQNFNEGDYVVYPAHGVGKLVGKETHTIGGHSLELLVINFDKDRMTLRLPIAKAKAAGLRALTGKEDMEKALSTLTVKMKARRLMWSRRAQEYENKINSGNPVSIAEVLRELYKTHADTDQSYSERQIYNAAMERFVRELAVIEKTDESAAVARVESLLKAA